MKTKTDDILRYSWITWIIEISSYYSRKISPPNFIVNFFWGKMNDEYKKDCVTLFTDWFYIPVYFVILFIAPFINNFLLFVLVLFRTIDMFFFYLYDIHQPRSSYAAGYRSIVITVINYFQIVLIYAFIYSHFIADKWQAIYLSLSTIATLTLPSNNNMYSKIPSWIVSSEAIIGIVFIGLIASKAIAIIMDYKKEKK